MNEMLSISRSGAESVARTCQTLPSRWSAEAKTAGEVLKKLREYFRAGVLLVWVIFPDVAAVHVYTSPKTVQILDVSDVLRREPVLPVFRLPLARRIEAERQE